MFPGTSHQTMREPDLGNPYRVDLGTAKKAVRTAAHKELVGNDDQALIGKMIADHEGVGLGGPTEATYLLENCG